MFTREDAAPGAAAVLISEALWTSQFGRDPGVLTRRIMLDGQAHTVVGVLSSRVRYPEARAMVWKALDTSVSDQPRRRIQTLVVRKPGVSMDELRARLSAATLSLQDQGTLTADQSLLFDDVIQVKVRALFRLAQRCRSIRPPSCGRNSASALDHHILTIKMVPI